MKISVKLTGQKLSWFDLKINRWLEYPDGCKKATLNFGHGLQDGQVFGTNSDGEVHILGPLFRRQQEIAYNVSILKYFSNKLMS